MTIEVSNEAITLPGYGGRSGGDATDAAGEQFRAALREALGSNEVPDRTLMSPGTMAAKRVQVEEELARRQAAEQAAEEVRGAHEPIGPAFGEIRQLFAEAGMPIIDMVSLSRTSIGEFRISGWGEGVNVSHPQARFIEAVLNGEAPEFADLTRDARAVIDKIEALFAKAQDIEKRNAPLLGREFSPRNSFFDEHVVMGAEHLADIEHTARQLSWRGADAFEAFKASLGDELDKLSHRQLLSRFHFESVTVPDLSDEFAAYF